LQNSRVEGGEEEGVAEKRAKDERDFGRGCGVVVGQV
jgi:hypothetical protein